MGTLEATLDVVELLSEENLEKIQYVARQLLMSQNNSGQVEEALTKQKFLEELEISRYQSKNGQYREAGEAVNDIRSRYGL